jgi:hypothetical protein
MAVLSVSTLVEQAFLLASVELVVILGIAMAANAPRIMTTISSSTNVNPFLLRICFSLKTLRLYSEFNQFLFISIGEDHPRLNEIQLLFMIYDLSKALTNTKSKIINHKSKPL